MKHARYLFWFIICGLFSYLLANKSVAAVGLGGEAGAFIYGGVIGLGVATATQSKLSWSLPFRVVAGVLWTICVTALYAVVFTAPDHHWGRNDVIFWGLVFGLPAPVICILRGVPMLFASRTNDSSKLDSRP